MKLGFYGKAIHFYMWFGRFFTKVMLIWLLVMTVSTILMISVPQFSSYKVGFEISPFVPLAIAQTVVTITVLVSMVGGVVLVALISPVALLEIPIEILLKKRVYKLVKERRKMSIDELVRETGVLENDLGFLLKNWIIRPGMEVNKVDMAAGTFKRGHMQIDLNAKELSWQE